MKLVAINEKGMRIGETHHRAKLSDHDIDLICSLLDARNDAIETALAAGMSQSCLAAHLSALQLSYRWIAAKFEISKSHVRWIAIGSQRGQAVARWKRASAQTKPSAV